MYADIHQGQIRGAAGYIPALLLAIVSLVRPVPPDAAQEGPPDPRAWTVCLESGPVAVTEIWLADVRGDRRLGVFPGKAGSLGWSDGRLYYVDRPLELPDHGMSVAGPRSGSPVSRTVWRLSPDGVSADRVLPDEAHAVSWSDHGQDHSRCDPEEGPGPPDGILSEFGRAIKSASSAYAALHQWDYKLARNRYRNAARQFARISEHAASTGLYQAPLEPYARTMRAHAQMAARGGARWVCRDHLEAIGELLTAYQAEHAGTRPASALELRVWAGQGLDRFERKTLRRLFRSSEDPDRDREISYLYAPQAGVGQAVFTSPYHRGRLVELVSGIDGYRLVDRAVGPSQVDSLLAEGVARLESSDPAAVPILEAVTHVSPDLAAGHCKLGYARLQAEDLDGAYRSFKKAVSLENGMAEAYNGLGMVYRKRPKGLYTAVQFFQKALRYDRDYLDARYQMATVRYDMNEHDVKHDLERILAADPAYAPAHLLLGKWYETQQGDPGAAALHYARYMSLKPDDPEGRRRLAAAYLSVENYDEIVDLLVEYVRRDPDESEVLPVLAQACLALSRTEWADRYFGEYLAGLDPEDRALYEDTSLLMSDDEQAELAQLGGEERAAYVRNFWFSRDPNLTTDANERRLEHYRRVWYSRTNFAAGQRPWDRRGEVYIRFGEPDYRSRSEMQNLEQTLAVQRVRERNARDLYGSAADRMSFAGGPVYAIRSLRSSLGGAPGLADGYETDRYALVVGETSERDALGFAAGSGTSSDDFSDQEGESTDDAILDEGDLEARRQQTTQTRSASPLGGMGDRTDYYFAFSPVTVQDDPSMVPWETWVYTDIGGGIEITFTDERLNGVFDYAPPPMEARIPIDQLARFNQYNPRRVTELAALVTPNYYVPVENEDPVVFYYDVADFRGGIEDQSNVEVYLGIPYRFSQYDADADETVVHVERTVALLNEKVGAVYRRQGDLQFASAGDLTKATGGFVPDQVDLDVPAGKYRLEVLVRDRLSGRQGRYRQNVVVDDYVGEGFRMSNLELAWRVTPTDEADKFTKGDLQVVPIPTRTIPLGAGLFVYYELYNMAQNEYGQTRYRVTYSVGPNRIRSGNHGLITQLVKVFSNETPQVAVGYEQLGKAGRERAYTELDLSKATPGKHYLKVEVTDLISGETRSRETTFVVAK